MSSGTLPAFRGHPDRPVDPPPKRSRGRKKPKSGNLFEQVPEPQLTSTAAQDAAVPPSTASVASPTQADDSRQDSGSSGTVTSAVEPPVQHDPVKADSAVCSTASAVVSPVGGTHGKPSTPPAPLTVESA